MGREGWKEEIGQGKGREASTWIFVQGSQVPSYATALQNSPVGHFELSACSMFHGVM